MQQLTDNERELIFSTYYGCPIRHQARNSDTPTDYAPFYFMGVMDVLGERKPQLIGDWSGGTQPQKAVSWCEWDECKLLVRSFTSLTDEEMITLAKIADKNIEYKKGNNHSCIIDRYVPVRSKVEGKDKVFIGIDRYVGDRYCGYEPFALFTDGYSIEQIDYLRSIRVNTTVHGKDLVECGVAVISELLTTKSGVI